MLDSLEALEDGGYFEDVTARLWGKRVGLSTMASRTEEGADILDSVAEFRAWADRTGARIEQFFPTRQMESKLVEERYIVQELPTLALAEYEDGELVHVTPCVADGSVETVEDRVSTISAMADIEAARESERDGSERELAPAKVQ